MARVLAVGIATVDIVNEVESYPSEDAEVRALAQTVRRGGNATNTLVVLSQLGHSCDWAGVMVDEPDAEFVLADLRRYRVGTDFCQRVTQGKVPTSYITLSRSRGSRTIVHYRDLSEFDFQAFRRIPLQLFDWVHFEGRNVSETRSMMRHLRDQRPDVPVSLEVEKPREDIDKLFPLADLILLSRAVAAHRACAPETLLREVREKAPDANLVCTLGEGGAVGLERSGGVVKSSAYPPPRLVDTIGAGDTFNAGMIDSLLRAAPLGESLEFACRLAANKCGQAGFHGLAIPRLRAESG